MTYAATPALICLNLQRNYLDPSSPQFVPRAAHALVHAQSCLGWARRRELPILHVHTLHGGASTPGSKPISGCEPLSTEALVFKRSRSFFDSVEFAKGVGRARYGDAFVLGFTGIRDCVAAAVDARRSGWRLVFVRDAIASEGLPPHDPTVVDAVLSAVLCELSGCANAADLIGRDVPASMIE